MAFKKGPIIFYVDDDDDKDNDSNKTDDELSKELLTFI